MKKPKFKIGDKVWAIETYGEETVKCPLCNGDGTVRARTEDYGNVVFVTQCPVCEGHGKIDTEQCGLSWTEPREIVGVAQEKENGKIVTYYKTNESWSGFSKEEERVFGTRKEAESEIKRRNKNALDRKIAEIKKELQEKEFGARRYPEI